MKGVVLAAAAASVLVVGSEALQLTKRDGPPRVVSLPFEKKSGPRPESTSRFRRRRAVSQTLDNFEDGSLYFANVTIGNPPQIFRFHIDTGSSDLWSNVKDSALCVQDDLAEEQGAIPCSVSGVYDANSSSTYEYINSVFDINYADGTGAKGDYVSDTLRFNKATIDTLQFGIGYESTSAQGVMGIGYPNLETQVQVAGLEPYSNIPQQMVKEGLINSPAYSLWLDDIYSATGNILFGGVDEDKYFGELQTLPIQSEQNQYLEMIVNLWGVDVIADGRNRSVLANPIPVLLDSGSTLTYLPTKTAKAIYSAVGATFLPRQSLAFCPCSVANSTDTLEFVFDGKIINVRMNELVLDQGLGPPSSNTGCTFGIVQQDASGSTGDTYTLGDTFIRNAYIVYDLAANEISIAQTNFNSATQKITEIVAPKEKSVSSGVAADAVVDSSSPSSSSTASSALAAPTALPGRMAWAGVAGAGLLLAAGF